VQSPWVTSPFLPEFLTEGDTLDDALENVRDALAAVIEIYRESGRSLPTVLAIPDQNGEIRAEMVIGVP